MIKIKNNSRLNYKAIGSVIDRYSSEDGFTMYEGMRDSIFFEYADRHYKLDVKYGKRDVTYIFSNVKEDI